MKKISLYFLTIISAMLFSCDSQLVDVVDEFTFETGGYMRTVTPFPVTFAGTFKTSLANLSGTKLELVAEAVTDNKGALFSSYELLVKFVDKTAANGNKSTTDKELKTYASSQFAVDAATGYPRTTISITGQEAMQKCGLTAADLAKGDFFTISATMILTNGKKFNAANSGVNITGGAFYSSPFAYQINVVD